LLVEFAVRQAGLFGLAIRSRSCPPGVSRNRSSPPALRRRLREAARVGQALAIWVQLPGMRVSLGLTLLLFSMLVVSLAGGVRLAAQATAQDHPGQYSAMDIETG